MYSAHNRPAYSKAPCYQIGLKFEDKVIKMLNAIPSDFESNFKYDIDYYYNNKAISLKSQPMALKTGNICFQLKKHFADGMIREGTYFTSQAEIYHIAIGETIYYLWADELKDYVNEFGWLAVKTLKASGQQRLANIGHPVTNVSIGLLNVNKLVKAELLNKLEY